MMPFPCRVCGGDSLASVTTSAGTLPFYSCPTCGSYSSPLPYSRAIYWRRYIETNLRAAHYNRAVLADVGQCHVELALRLCPPPARMLDVGCLECCLLERFLEAGYDAHGFDVIDGLPEWLKQNTEIEPARVAIADNLRPDIFDAPFDFALCREVIEHVPDPHGTLRAIHDCLKPGGWFQVQTPLPMTTPGVWEAMEHIQVFSERALFDALARAGFEAVPGMVKNWGAGIWIVARRPFQ